MYVPLLARQTPGHITASDFDTLFVPLLITTTAGCQQAETSSRWPPIGPLFSLSLVATRGMGQAPLIRRENTTIA
jgi:hypothetical protein